MLNMISQIQKVDYHVFSPVQNLRIMYQYIHTIEIKYNYVEKTSKGGNEEEERLFVEDTLCSNTTLARHSKIMEAHPL